MSIIAHFAQKVNAVFNFGQSLIIVFFTAFLKPLIIIRYEKGVRFSC